MSRGSKQTTHEDILKATRKLFTESGYNNVSLRDIAGELGISVGNLTYYYKSKVELIEAAILDKREKSGHHTPACTLQELDALLAQSQQIQEEHLYYYRQYSQLSVISDAIRDLQVEIYQEQQAVWQKTLDNLRQAGLMEPEQTANQSALLVSAILFISARWHERDMLDGTLGIQTPAFKDAVWALLVPALTDKGMEIYRETIAK